MITALGHYGTRGTMMRWNYRDDEELEGWMQSAVQEDGVFAWFLVRSFHAPGVTQCAAYSSIYKYRVSADLCVLGFLAKSA